MSQVKDCNFSVVDFSKLFLKISDLKKSQEKEYLSKDNYVCKV